MQNRYAALSKQNLKDVELRLLNELANYRLDSKRARQRLSDARSAIAETRFELKMVEEALRLAEVIPFPSLSLPAVPDSAVDLPEEVSPLKHRQSG